MSTQQQIYTAFVYKLESYISSVELTGHDSDQTLERKEECLAVFSKVKNKRQATELMASAKDLLLS